MSPLGEVGVRTTAPSCRFDSAGKPRATSASPIRRKAAVLFVFDRSIDQNGSVPRIRRSPVSGDSTEAPPKEGGSVREGAAGAGAAEVVSSEAGLPGEQA